MFLLGMKIVHVTSTRRLTYQLWRPILIFSDIDRGAFLLGDGRA